MVYFEEDFAAVKSTLKSAVFIFGIHTIRHLHQRAEPLVFENHADHKTNEELLENKKIALSFSFRKKKIKVENKPRG